MTLVMGKKIKLAYKMHFLCSRARPTYWQIFFAFNQQSEIHSSIDVNVMKKVEVFPTLTCKYFFLKFFMKIDFYQHVK